MLHFKIKLFTSMVSYVYVLSIIMLKLLIKLHKNISCFLIKVFSIMQPFRPITIFLHPFIIKKLLRKSKHYNLEKVVFNNEYQGLYFCIS